MPHISMTLYPGRSPEEIRRIAEALRTSLMETVGWKAGDISVSVREEKPDTFAQTVERQLASEQLILDSDHIRP